MRRPDRAYLRDRHARVREQLEQERLEVVVGSVDLVDEQHRRSRAGVLERAQERAADEVVRPEELLLPERRLRESASRMLRSWRIVPLVQRRPRRSPRNTGGAPAGSRGRARRTWRPRSCRHPPRPRAERLRQAQAQEHRGRQALVDRGSRRPRDVGRASRCRGRARISSAASPVAPRGLTAASGRTAAPRTWRGIPRSRSRRSRRRASTEGVLATAATVIQQIGSTARAGAGARAGSERGGVRSGSNGRSALPTAHCRHGREDRERDLGRRLGADVDAGGHVDAIEVLLGNAIGTQFGEQPHRACGWPPGRRYGTPVSSPRAGDVQLVAAMRRHDEREIARRRLGTRSPPR